MIKIWIGNLAAYNAGELRGEWIELPASEEELSALYERIGGEEHIIMDYESDIDGLHIGELDDVGELNEAAEAIDGYNEDERAALGAYLSDGCDLSDAIQHVTYGAYIIYDGCYNMADVAEQVCDECGILDKMPDNLRGYFDFAAYGRDMAIDGTFIRSDRGYIELCY